MKDGYGIKHVQHYTMIENVHWLNNSNQRDFMPERQTDREIESHTHSIAQEALNASTLYSVLLWLLLCSNFCFCCFCSVCWRHQCSAWLTYWYQSSHINLGTRIAWGATYVYSRCYNKLEAHHTHHKIQKKERIIIVYHIDIFAVVLCASVSFGTHKSAHRTPHTAQAKQ